MLDFLFKVAVTTVFTIVVMAGVAVVGFAILLILAAVYNLFGTVAVVILVIFAAVFFVAWKE